MNGTTMDIGVTQRKKVLFLTYGFSLGGAETLFVRLMNALSQGEVEPVVATLATGELRAQLNDAIRVVDIPRKSRFDMSPVSALAGLLNAEQIDTVVALGFFASFFVRRALARVHHPVRSLVWVHGTRPRTVKEFLQMFAYARLLRKRDAVITLCHAQANFLHRAYGIPTHQCMTVYNGIDPEYWNLPPSTFSRDTQRRSMGIPDDAHVIVQVAMFRPEKRHADTVRALAFAHHRTAARPYLVLVGDGDPDIIAEVKALAQREGIGPYVVFCGRQGDVRPFLWMSDVLVLSSATETFPMAALEALACGLPIVMTNVGGAREIITEDFLGIVVPPRDPPSMATAWLRLLLRHRADGQDIHQTIEHRFPFNGFVRRFEWLLRDVETELQTP